MIHNQKLSTLRHTSKEEEDDLFLPAIPPIIFDARTLDDPPPSGFNAIRIPLNASIKADLFWEPERKAAEKYIQQGFRIFWDIDLGLFKNLPQPITNQSQFLSLSLALDHFRNTLWKDFSRDTVGLCLYRGTADFSLEYIWDEQQLNNLKEWFKDVFIDIESFVSETRCFVSSFEEIDLEKLLSTPYGSRMLAIYCKNVAEEYFELLADCLPDLLQCYVLLDIESISDISLQVQLTARESFSKINLGIRGAQFNSNILAWNGSPGQLGVISREEISKKKNNPKVGICLPSKIKDLPSKWKSLENVFINLKEKNIPFRAIPEVTLTTEWDGLDCLIVPLQDLSVQGHRKLQGFRAAGGLIIPADEFALYFDHMICSH